MTPPPPFPFLQSLRTPSATRRAPSDVPYKKHFSRARTSPETPRMPRGGTRLTNDNAERMLGYAASEMINHISTADGSTPNEVIRKAVALNPELGTRIRRLFAPWVFKASPGIARIDQIPHTGWFPLNLINPQAQKRGILRIFPTFTEPCSLKTDSTRLKHGLINLLSQAIKYNRNGGPVTEDWRETSASYIRFSEKDSGTGLSAEILAHLLQAFKRLGKEATAEKGTGTALLVSKFLIELIQGKTDATSTARPGSLFRIEHIHDKKITSTGFFKYITKPINVAEFRHTQSHRRFRGKTQRSIHPGPVYQAARILALTSPRPMGGRKPTPSLTFFHQRVK